MSFNFNLIFFDNYLLIVKWLQFHWNENEQTQPSDLLRIKQYKHLKQLNYKIAADIVYQLKIVVPDSFLLSICSQ